VTNTPILAIVKPVLLFIAGQEEQAADYLSQALANPDPWIQATSLAMRARFAENSGDIVAVRADTAVAIARYESVGDEVGLASVLPLAAGLLAYDGDVSGAVNLLTKALRLLDDQSAGAIEVDDRLYILLRLSDMHGRLGEWDAARSYAEAASEMADSIGSAEWRALTAVLRGGMLRASGDFEAAQRLQTEAEDLLSQASRSLFTMHHGTAVVAAFGAAAAIDAGDLERARCQVDIAYTAGRASKDMPIVATVVVAEAMLALAYGEAARASFRLGLAARIRGADDPTDLMVARITAGAREVLGADGTLGAVVGQLGGKPRGSDRSGRSGPGSGATTVGARRQGDEHDEQPGHPDECPQHVRGHWSAEHQASHRVHQMGDRVDLDETLQPAWHRPGLNEGVAGKGERQYEKEHNPLHRAWGAHDHAHPHRDPAEAQGERDRNRDCGDRCGGVGLGREKHNIPEAA
jgi:tetratricopeptide (TPR) repeat protein